MSVFVLILVGGFQPFYWRMLTPEGSSLRTRLVDLAFTKTPGLRIFMLGVRDRTRDGERIAIVTPARRFQEGYGYAFTRSTYLLAGRPTVPIVGEQDEWMPQNIAMADVVAVWHTEVELPGFRLVWRDQHGALYRRIR